MQRLIRSKFSSHTIIAVAHKLDTILDFDKVAVLDKGVLVEYDDPYVLLNNPDSAFARLYNSTDAGQENEVVDDEDGPGLSIAMSPNASERSPSMVSRLSTPVSDIVALPPGGPLSDK
jgi:ABC-type proline/glycine betaine transport system ATPase subunit